MLSLPILSNPYLSRPILRGILLPRLLPQIEDCQTHVSSHRATQSRSSSGDDITNLMVMSRGCDRKLSSRIFLSQHGAGEGSLHAKPASGKWRTCQTICPLAYLPSISATLGCRKVIVQAWNRIEFKRLLPRRFNRLTQPSGRADSALISDFAQGARAAVLNTIPVKNQAVKMHIADIAVFLKNMIFNIEKNNGLNS